MNNCPNRRRDARRDSVSAPFGGLGFDMAQVVKTSARMTARYCPLPTGEEFIPAGAFDCAVGPYGFALLTALGREIRGR